MIKRFRSGAYFSLSAQKRLAWLLLIALVVAYMVAMCAVSILRYTTFKATAFDLGNMDQAAWNTLHGHLFEFTNHSSNWYGAPIRLAQHVEPIFFLLSLFYVFFADPRTLLIIQTVVLAAGAIPVFLLARKSLPTLPLLAPLMALGYLLAPALIGENIFDFHALTLVSSFLLYAVLALTYRRSVWFVIFCILTAACKEDMGLVVALLALLAIWKYRIPRLGAIVCICGILWSAIAFGIIMPHFNVGAQQNNFWYRYQALGPSPVAAIFNVLTHPWIIFGVLITLDRVWYLASLLRSTGFIALLAPEWLIPTLPSLAINLLTSESFQHNGIFHYHAAIIPFVVIAAIQGTRRLYLYWYGLRDEETEQELYREDVVLERTTYAPGKPIPGTAVAITTICNAAIRLWHGIAKGWRMLVTRLHLTHGLNAGHKRRLILRSRMQDLAHWLPASWLQGVLAIWFVCMIALNLVVIWPQLYSFLPNAMPVARQQHIQQLLDMIPKDAVVSASGTLNPHLTERRYVTVFPELTVSTMTPGQAIPVQYVIVDLNQVSPEDLTFSDNFLDILNQIQHTGEFRPLAQADGVILLVRAKP
ncbi:DUF2079 domain-containing protein [Dictyobacter arantiisoli]|uniref:DUF2079 domain-containing protein n=1 Tax=Dictyobacter arantiisoli TaxID=2014874 RepID=A0A5A5T882_9CHLR|nr:DUF2079 domain-containing protein [Dictyobacter arantiisoli]GCF07179.1 hypothetical protein KDI_07430 [Dictyobacter arantiisoli]